MKKNNNVLIILTTIMSSLALIFLCLFLSFMITSNNYKKELENGYKKNFYEMVSNINDLEVDISKLVATNEISSQRELLNGICETSKLGVNNVNLLPITYNKMTKINNLLNKMNGFMYSLLLETYDGKKISSDDFLQINNLHEMIIDIQYDLNDYMAKLDNDYSILDEVDFGDNELSDFSAGIVNTESSNSEVPSLIYDGPFADSVLNKEIIGLPDIEYSVEDVEEKLHYLYPGYTINYVGDSTGKFETYNFEVGGDISLYISVTKKGGVLLTITAFGSGGDKSLSVEEGITLAETYAKDVGFDSMYNVWHQDTGNVLYVNLAPIKNKVIYYSDLIKVKVDLSLGLVVGWEATNYATNHQERSFSSEIGILDAQKNINGILTIKERNLCIIPDKYVGEINAYEFICTWKNYTYYIYLDSVTGKEVNILRVIDTDNGSLLM